MTRPRESNDERRPVVLPCPAFDFFVNNAETAGRMTPFPIPKIDKKMAAVRKLLTNKMRKNPIADAIVPA